MNIRNTEGTAVVRTAECMPTLRGAHATTSLLDKQTIELGDLAWARSGLLTTARSDHEGSQPAQFDLRAGLLKPDTNKASRNAAFMASPALASGAAGVSITNGRFPQIDTCVIAKTIAEKTP